MIDNWSFWIFKENLEFLAKDPSLVLAPTLGSSQMLHLQGSKPFSDLSRQCTHTYPHTGRCPYTQLKLKSILKKLNLEVHVCSFQQRQEDLCEYWSTRPYGKHSECQNRWVYIESFVSKNQKRGKQQIPKIGFEILIQVVVVKTILVLFMMLISSICRVCCPWVWLRLWSSHIVHAVVNQGCRLACSPRTLTIEMPEWMEYSLQ